MSKYKIIGPGCSFFSDAVMILFAWGMMNWTVTAMQARSAFLSSFEAIMIATSIVLPLFEMNAYAWRNQIDLWIHKAALLVILLCLIALGCQIMLSYDEFSMDHSGAFLLVLYICGVMGMTLAFGMRSIVRKKLMPTPTAFIIFPSLCGVLLVYIATIWLKLSSGHVNTVIFLLVLAIWSLGLLLYAFLSFIKEHSGFLASFLPFILFVSLFVTGYLVWAIWGGRDLAI